MKIHIAGIGLIILAFLTVTLTTTGQKQITTYISTFGILGLLGLIFVTSTSVLVRVWRNEFTTALTVHRRWIGLYSFFFALIHVLLVANFFFNWNITKMLENQWRAVGGGALLLLTAMAATSNDWSMKTLAGNWKRLHLIVYIAIALVIAHSFNLGQVFLKGDIGKAVIAVLVLAMVAGKLLYQYKIFGKKDKAVGQTA